MSTLAPPSPVAEPVPTQQDQAAEQLKIANYYLRVALDQVPDGVMILETGPIEGSGPVIIYSNAAAACLLGLEPGKGLRGLHLDELVAGAADLAALQGALRSATEGGATECEAHLQTRYGPVPVRCKWRVRAVFNNMRRLLNYTITVTSLSQAQAAAPAPKVEDLDSQSDRLRVENLAALAQGIAHDINNLLGPVTARLSEIIPALAPESPLAQELSLAFAGLKRARQFTGQVVKAAKARPGKCEPTDISGVIRDTVQLSQAGANVSVRVSVPQDLNWAVADPVKISQVLQNLVMNGIQAMPNGGYMDVAAQNLTLASGQDPRLQGGRYVEIFVRDRGTGIAPENLQRLFREMFTTKPDGNGIGLSTCKRFIDDHGGDIRVTSILNQGSEFRILLPAIPPLRQAGQPSPAGQASPLALKSGKGTVLIVDDELELRHIAASILLKCGYRVFECDTGHAAVEAYRNLARQGETPDVVLMDLTLRGGMSGCEATAEILRFDPAARIVVTSGSVSEDVQMAFLEQGFVDVLPKPYEAGELSQKVFRVATMRTQAATAA